jgi:NAD(P)H-hydrate epimerase
MEKNAAHRVVEVLERQFAPLGEQRIVIFAGKGNNGGDGLAIARLLHSRFRPRTLDVVLAAEPRPAGGAAAGERLYGHPRDDPRPGRGRRPWLSTRCSARA